MTTIVEGTFNTCVNLEKVNLGYGVKTIESGAFYRCESLKTIIMPSNVNQIGETAFEYVGGFTICGEPGSYAQAYANSYDRPFMPIDSLGEPPAVTSASASKSTLVAGESVTFTVKTPSAAKYLAMYSETGAKAKTWPAVENSTVSNNVRTWKVTYAIKTAGSRRLTFKASIDNAEYGDGCAVSITVAAAPPSVTSAAASETTVAAKAPVTFTVKTPKDAKFLAMFSESGSKVKVWSYSNYSKVSGGTRVWTVSYAISNKGNRQLTFRCTKTTTYGEGKTVDLKVVAEQPAVTRVSANKSTVAAKEAVTFTVKTPASAKYVALFTESGTKVKAWGMTGNSTVSGDVRTWTIRYAIASKGDSRLTFRATTNGVYGAGKTVNVTVK